MVMKPEILEKLRGAVTSSELEKLIGALCAPYGEIHKLDLVANAGGGYLCFVEMGSPGQQYLMMRELGGGAFGAGLCFTIPPTQSLTH
jgi:hypothetical protein